MNPGSFCGTCGSAVKVGALYCGPCGNPALAPPAPAVAAPPAMISTVGGGARRVPSPAERGHFPTASTFGPTGFVGYATFGRRVGAYIIDAIPAWIIATIGYVAFFAAALGRSSGGMWFSLVLMLAGPIAYFGVLWAMAAKGSSPGNAILGIRVVCESTGFQPGAGLGLGRLLLKGLLIGITFCIGGFSPLWDRTGRRKGWWDSACNTVVLDRDAVSAYQAAVLNGSTPLYGPAHPVAETEAPAWPDPTAAGPDVGAVGGAFEDVDDRPSWDLQPVQAPSTGTSRVHEAPAPVAASWGDQPVPMEGGIGVASAGKVTIPPPPPPPPPDWGATPRHSVELNDSLGMSSPVESGSGVITSIPGFRPSGSDAPPVAPDHTRMRVTPRTTSASGWVADLDDGRAIPLEGPVLVGRDPSGRTDERDAQTVPVLDEGRSVSKTHLRLDVGPAGVLVTDRHSTNGVIIVTAGVEMRCVPGVGTPVPDHSTVRFGDRHLLVRRMPATGPTALEHVPS